MNNRKYDFGKVKYKYMEDKKNSFMDKTKSLAKVTKNKFTQAADKSKELSEKTKQEIINTLDANGDGKVELEDIIIKGMELPGVKIARGDFLRRELMKKYESEIIEKAILENPMKAGIKEEDINEIADHVIAYERNCVSGISAALGMPGGLAAIATIPADIIQYYGYMLRAMQKLLYLYGFPELNVEVDGANFDSETMNIMILCFGVMNRVAGAKNALLCISKKLADGVYKQLVHKALTKGTIYPIVKKVSKWFGVKMTKEVFAGFFKKSIPLIGGAIGGTMTYLSFKPCCSRLQDSLKDTILSNPNYVDKDDLNEVDIIDIDINDIEDIDEE